MRRALLTVPALAAMISVVLPQGAAVADTASRCVNDQSYSIKVCLYQTYNTTYYASKPYAQLPTNPYRFTWTRLDSRAYVTSVLMRAGYRSTCWADDPSWCHSGESAQTRTISAPSASTSYYLTPAWYGKWTKVWGSLQYQCGNVEVSWSLSGRAMSKVILPNVCVGSQW